MGGRPNTQTSWWLNQPIWKNMNVKFDHFPKGPRDRGESKKYLSCHHQIHKGRTPNSLGDWGRSCHPNCNLQVSEGRFNGYTDTVDGSEISRPPTVWMYKNLANHGINYQSQLVIAGVLKHQQYSQSLRIPVILGIWFSSKSLFILFCLDFLASKSGFLSQYEQSLLECNKF